MPSHVIKRLLESNDPQVEVPESKVSRKRKQQPKPEKPCSEQALVAAHIRSLLVLDRKLKYKSVSVATDLTKTKKKPAELQSQSQAFGRTTAAQARTLAVPTFDKRKHAKETKKRRLVDIAKLLQKQSKGRL